MWCSSAVNFSRLSALRFRVRVGVPSTQFPGSVSGLRVTPRRFPWLRPFPPPPPQSQPPQKLGLALCSTASSVLMELLAIPLSEQKTLAKWLVIWTHPTSHRCGWQGCGFPFLPRPTLLRRAPVRPPSSCASNFLTCSVSPTAQDHSKARV